MPVVVSQACDYISHFCHTNNHGAQDFWQSFSKKCMYLEYDWLLRHSGLESL